jgi:hypothetical protein
MTAMAAASAGEYCLNGDIYAGSPSAGKYLIAAPADESGTYRWDNGGCFRCGDGTVATSNTDGEANVSDMRAYNNVGTLDGFDAARQCDQKSITVGGTTYDDWYLPARDELCQLWEVLRNPDDPDGCDGTNDSTNNGPAAGTFSNTAYWSSTETNNGVAAWRQNFGSGNQGTNNKSYNRAVRCVRQVVEPGVEIAGGICAEAGGCDGTNDLIAAPADESGTYEWSNNYSNHNADSSTDGYANTDWLATSSGDTHPAANVCWNKTLNGYSDWYLPARDELDQLYTDLHNNGSLGNFQNTFYWSSTENAPFNGFAWRQYFGNGNQSDTSKGLNFAVRCVRSN